MNIPHRAFLQWFALLLTYVSALFFAGYAGLLQSIYHTDVTYMTSVIAVVFVASAFYLGFAAWRFDSHPERIRKVIADAGIGRAAAEIIVRIGLLGTVIGLMLQVKALANIDLSNQANLLMSFTTICSSLLTAFYATACGIVGSVGIIIMTANIDFFIDLGEEH